MDEGGRSHGVIDRRGEVLEAVELLHVVDALDGQRRQRGIHPGQINHLELRLHLLRVALAVTGIQFWLWALAVPVPIWQGIALLMTSPLFATLGSALFLKEQVSRARILATLAGFVGAMLILAPWTDDFTLASLLPVAAASSARPDSRCTGGTTTPTSASCLAVCRRKTCW